MQDDYDEAIHEQFRQQWNRYLDENAHQIAQAIKTRLMLVDKSDDDITVWDIHGHPRHMVDQLRGLPMQGKKHRHRHGQIADTRRCVVPWELLQHAIGLLEEFDRRMELLVK